MKEIILRKYDPSDCAELAALFYNTVHTINAKDYTKEQLYAWANGHMNLNEWNTSFLNHYSVIAVKDDTIVGFGDIDIKSGCLDRLFVHANYQCQGIGTAICTRLENAVSGKITVHASITARDFFAKRGYITLKRQQVERKGILLTNFLMEKSI